MMSAKPKHRRSIWTWGLESEEPTDGERAAHAAELSERFGVEIVAPPIPRVEDLELRPPRISVPAGFEAFCFTDSYERALHSYSADDRASAGIRTLLRTRPMWLPTPAPSSELERDCSNGATRTGLCRQSHSAAVLPWSVALPRPKPTRL